MSARVVTAVSIVAAVVAVALAFLPWVDTRAVGGPGYWNGFGTFHGPDYYAEFLAGLINPLGWVVAGAAVLASAALISSLWGIPWLRFVAFGFSAVAFATTTLCLVKPSTLVGGALRELGVDAIPAGDVVATGTLACELVATVLLLVFTAFTAVERRTPPAAPRIPAPEPHPEPRADA